MVNYIKRFSKKMIIVAIPKPTAYGTTYDETDTNIWKQ